MYLFSFLFLGYIECLAQLTVVGEVNQEAFNDRFLYMSERKDTYFPQVITDEAGKIVAAGTLIVERKFIRNCGACGHIEDIVVDSAQRGKNLGKILLKRLRELALNELGCYKVILDCEEGKVPFYEKCGFTEKGRQMTLYKKT